MQATHDRLWQAGEVGRSVLHFAHSGPEKVVRSVGGVFCALCAPLVGDLVKPPGAECTGFACGKGGETTVKRVLSQDKDTLTLYVSAWSRRLSHTCNSKG